MSSEHPFDPNSHNAMFAKILAEMRNIEVNFSRRMDDQDTVLEEIKTQTTKTNGRVTKIEMFITALKSKVVLASGAMSSGIAAIAWMLEKGWIKIP